MQESGLDLEGGDKQGSQHRAGSDIRGVPGLLQAEYSFVSIGEDKMELLLGNERTGPSQVHLALDITIDVFENDAAGI